MESTAKDTSKIIGIKIKTLDNALHEFSISKDNTISDLKQKIFVQLNIPVTRQRIIFQGKLLHNHDLISTYKIEDGHVLHLVANPAYNDSERENSTAQQQQQQQPNQQTNAQPQHQNEQQAHSNIQESLQDYEILSGIIRTMSILTEPFTSILTILLKGESTFNRRNLRRRLLQQRTNGFNIDPQEHMEVLRQNFQNIDLLMSSFTKPEELSQQENVYTNPFNFSQRKLHIGQWVDVKDTIDQWLEAQVINVQGNQAYIHYNGWGTRWDEWIDMNSPRIALFRTYTVQSASSRYMSPMPNFTLDGDTTHIPNHQVDPNDLIYDMGNILSKISVMTAKLHELQTAPKSDKQSVHNKQEASMELQNVISGMIEEQKIQTEKEKEKNVTFEDATSLKSHKSHDKNPESDALSFKSMKSIKSISAFSNAGRDQMINFPDYISEEDSQERSEISSNIPAPHPQHLKENMIALMASQLAPLFDRVGRLMIDMAPHLAILGGNIQAISLPNQNLTNLSILTNESQQNQGPSQNRTYAFQVPVMLTPGEVTQANSTSQNSRNLNESGNIDIHVHAIIGPFRNQGNSTTQQQQSQTQANTSQINLGSNPSNQNQTESVHTHGRYQGNRSQMMSNGATTTGSNSRNTSQLGTHSPRVTPNNTSEVYSPSQRLITLNTNSNPSTTNTSQISLPQQMQESQSIFSQQNNQYNNTQQTQSNGIDLNSQLGALNDQQQSLEQLMRSESNLFQEYGDQPVLNERAVDSLPTQDKFKGKNSWSPNETENLSDVSFDSKKHLNCNAENPFSLLPQINGDHKKNITDELNEESQDQEADFLQNKIQKTSELKQKSNDDREQESDSQKKPEK